jgi:hypothetical protein
MTTPVTWAPIRPYGPRLDDGHSCGRSIPSRPPVAAWVWPWRVWGSPGNDRARLWHAARPPGARHKGAQTRARRAPADHDPAAGRDQHDRNPTPITLLRSAWATGLHPHARPSGHTRAPRRAQRAHGRAGMVEHGPGGSSHASILPHHGASLVARMAHGVVRRPRSAPYRRGAAGRSGCVAHCDAVSACGHTRMARHGPLVAAGPKLGARRSGDCVHRYLGGEGLSVSARAQPARAAEKGWGALWPFLAHPMIGDRTFCSLLSAVLTKSLDREPSSSYSTTHEATQICTTTHRG